MKILIKMHVSLYLKDIISINYAKLTAKEQLDFLMFFTFHAFLNSYMVALKSNAKISKHHTQFKLKQTIVTDFLEGWLNIFLLYLYDLNSIFI